MTTPVVRLTPQPILGAGHWRGTFERQRCRPSEDLEVSWLPDATAPRAAFHVETGSDGERYFLAVVQAGPAGLQEVALDLGEATDVVPERIDDLPPGERALVLCRLGSGDPTPLGLRARAGRGDVALSAPPERATGPYIGALWALQRIESLCRSAKPDEETLGVLVDLAARRQVLTRYNAFLAEE